VIPQAFITEWGNRVPWPESYQVEQDLILSRLMIEIAENELLKDEFVMRGGTCLHKVHLKKPRRYSEDLDYVRRTHSGIKPYIDELRGIADRVGLTVSNVNSSGPMVHLYLDTEATGGGGIRVKVETNIGETDFFKKPTALDHDVDSRWWSGKAKIPTFVLDEMMSTKTRALYQRRKGRDLFDLWLVLTYETVSSDEIVAGLRHYMKDSVFTYPQLRQNLAEKLADAGFRSDLDTLVTAAPEDYEVEVASGVVMEKLGSLLDNAPSIEEIRDGRWRSQD
jgi:predicted nucleotidyltransferase component of viral defense system